MNLAVTTATTSTWKTVKRNYVAAIGGVALTAVALFGALNSGNTNTSTPPSQPLSPAAASARNVVPASPAMTYYIVGSEEQLHIVQAGAEALAADNAVYAPKNNWKFEVLVAGSSEDESAVRATISDAKERWANAGASGLEIVDLRTR